MSVFGKAGSALGSKFISDFLANYARISVAIKKSECCEINFFWVFLRLSLKKKFGL